MKIKLLIMILAVAFLVGYVPPSSAHAGVEDFPVLPNGWSHDYYYGYSKNATNTYLYGSSAPFTVRSSKADDYVENVSDVYIYKWNGAEWVYSSFVSAGTLSSPNTYIVLSNHNIYDSKGVLFFEKNYEPTYSFANWCVDAGLKCRASSNESTLVIPYSYNNYWHIVRKTSNGKYLLTTIGNSVMTDNIEDYTLLLSEDMGSFKVWNLYSMEDTNGYLLNIRQYEYDTDGWRLLSYNTYDSRDTDDCIIDIGSGSGIDQTKILVYTSANIYHEKGLELLVASSEEYGDIQLEIPENSETEDKPTITPKPTTTPIIDLTGLDKTLKLEDVTKTGFKYNGIEYKWGNIQTHINNNDLEDYAVFFDDYNKQLVFVWAFDDFIVGGLLHKPGIRYFEYYFEFVTEVNNSSVLPYAITTYQINNDGTLTETNILYTHENEENHQFKFAWTKADYAPRLDDFSTFDNYVTYVLENNVIVSNCNIFNNSGVQLKTAIEIDNSKIILDEIPDSEFGVIKQFIYNKLPIIGTIEVFIAKFKSVLNTMKETNKAPEIIMNVNNFYGYSGELNVLDLSWYEPYREYVKAIISALLIVPFILWVYRKGLPDAIGGI